LSHRTRNASETSGLEARKISRKASSLARMSVAVVG
jgi:hypothetical protein